MPRDHFLDSFSPSGSFVFNTQTSEKSGEHWISVFSNGKEIEYFDSYGLPPSIYPDVGKMLQQWGIPIVWNGECLQEESTNVCGDYCILFCLLRARGWSMEGIITRLSRVEGRVRDHSIRALLQRLYYNKRNNTFPLTTHVNNIMLFSPFHFD